MLKAVIFDFDGVLADTERLHLDGFRHALAAYEISISQADYFARYLGCDDRDGFAAILRDHGREADGATVRRLMAHKERVFRELVSERVELFPGVRDLLGELRSEPRLTVGIGSGALRSEVLLVLDVAGLRDSFDAVVAADEVRRSKPDPETFELALRRLARGCAGLGAEHCVVIEDSAAGLQAARRAHMHSVGVAHSYPASELKADLVVGALGELSRERLVELVESCDRRSTQETEGT